MNTTKLLLTKLTQSPFRNVSTTTLRNAYCTTTATLTHNSTKRTFDKRNVSLYKTIAPLGNPNFSITPVIDQWINQGHSVDEVELRNIVTELRRFRRFKHALEVLTWMTEKTFVEVTATDAATRLELISRVYGVEAAENYFNLTPTKLKTVEVYDALLKCYARANCVEKAEGVMQKLRDLGFASYTLSHNVMLNLYCRTQNRDKVADVLLEMEANNIKYDCHTYTILLNAYGGVHDIDGLETILSKMESDPELDIDWVTYSVAANHYIGAQLEDKALESLRKSEKLVKLLKKKNDAYTYVLRLYAALGKKEEVLRVWEECKKCRATNRDYMSLFRTFLMYNDVETAENIYKEWEDSKLLMDIRIPNILIKIYCKNSLIEKAEALIERMKSKKSQNPDSYLWSWMSFGYVKRNQMDKAVEAVKSALSETNCLVFRRNRLEGLAACLKYLKDEEDSEEQLNAIIETLKERRLVPAKVLGKLVDNLSGKGDIEDVLKMDDEEETLNIKEHEFGDDN